MQLEKIEAWASLDTSIRDEIKKGAILTLNSSQAIARHTGAQLVAKLGVIELPRKEWPGLLTTLLYNVTNGSEGTQHATLETLGYLCDGLSDDDVIEPADTNSILTAIVDGVRADRTNAIRLAAIKALRHSLAFIGENFGRDAERNHIMQVVCEATQSPDVQVRVVAFECIATIPCLYYEYLEPYMSALYELTFKAVTTDQVEVALQSLEFWSSISEEEAILIEDMQSYQEQSLECKYYIKNILTQLIPLLTQGLMQQEEDQDDMSWNLSMASATCLNLVAQAVRDDCVDLTMAFIQQNIQAQDWHAKEAAIMAFGSILEGPSSVKLHTTITQALPLLMQCMKDENIIIRDTAAWTVGRICDFHAECISNNMLEPLMQLFVLGLKQEPRVAHNISYAIHNLTKAFEKAPETTALLSPYFTVLFDTLLETTVRSDCMEKNLRSVAYESITSLIQIADAVSLNHVVIRLPSMLDQLESTFTAHAGHDVDHVIGLQGLICGALLVTCQQPDFNVRQFADRIMKDMLHIVQDSNHAADEEAFMVIGAVATSLEKDFNRYMEHFAPNLLVGLKNHSDYMLCIVAVGIVGDLCRSLEKEMKPYCDGLVGCILESLSSPTLNRSVKPPLLSSFGDFALALEEDFVRYLEPAMAILQQAATACAVVDTNAVDEEMVEYMNTLREAIIEAYTGIVQGLPASMSGSLLAPYVVNIGQFIASLSVDDKSRWMSEELTVSMVGLVGDMAANIGKECVQLVQQDFIMKIVNECCTASSSSHRNIGNWTKEVYISPTSHNI